MSTERFAGRVALVTGGARGIGAALVQRFLDEGAAVVVADIDTRIDPELARRAEETSRLSILQVDVANEESCRAMAATVEQLHGRLDILVNNAGVYPTQMFDQMSFADWRRIMAINLDGPFLVTRSVLSLMKAHRYGRIVNFSSSTVFLGTEGFTHYAGAKAGVIGFSRCLASEVGRFGITVNVVSPGLTNTETAMENIPEHFRAARGEQRALKRQQQPDDLVGTVAFLSSDDAAFMTGQTLSVDGGVVFR
jgi:NAD(P)-dependent dehydrogenase (short-subunit alcohol dehydrogenase family)